MFRVSCSSFHASAALVACLISGALSAAETPSGESAAAGSELEEITITATKRAEAVSVHDSPFAITAFGSATLADAHVDELSDLTSLVPNVFLNSSDTVQGVNNFSIRGMAVYDTIPSNTPTVGIFVDGIYVGASAGSALNTFDNASVEVLRGPQGLLFGRNVTAGAVLVNTSDPTNDLHVSARAAVESGLEYTESAVISGPLMDGGVLDGKLAGYRSDDEGYFKNQYDGRPFERLTTTIVRGAFLVRPNELFRTTVRYEHGDVNGDGPASQNHGAFSPDTFDFSINNPGFAHDRWDQIIADTRAKVAFGNGEVVDVLGWRQVSESGSFDADGTPQTFFDFNTDIDQHQVSNELRYSGTLGPVVPTAGIYYYTDHLNYIENRQLAAANITGGGLQDSTTYAVFSNFDVTLPADLTLTLGARYSREKKTAHVQALSASAVSPCSFDARECSAFDFNGNNVWNAFTPKIGLQWSPVRSLNVYGYWTKGFRSGGYNLRQTNPAVPPGPYDQEVENTFEVGAKKNLFSDRLRINVTAFVNKYTNLQRAITVASPTLGIVQTTVNSADTQIAGFESEVMAAVTERLRAGVNVGYLHNHWSRIYYNLLGTGPVTPANYDLGLPFLSPWSFGANLDYTVQTLLGDATAQANFSHRDRTPSNDANTGWLKAVNRLDANLSLHAAHGVVYSIYGKNLTNQVTYGLNNPLTFTPRETIAPLNKGRILGVELRYRF
jgi:iron complex outermembrane recepter protein